MVDKMMNEARVSGHATYEGITIDRMVKFDLLNRLCIIYVVSKDNRGFLTLNEDRARKKLEVLIGDIHQS